MPPARRAGRRSHGFWLSGERAGADAPPAVRMQLGHALRADEVRTYDAGTNSLH